MIIAWWLRWRWYAIALAWTISILATGYKVWDWTKDDCRVSALEKTVSDEKDLHEIRNNRPDNDGLFDILRHGSF